MRRFQNFIKKLISVKDNERSLDEKKAHAKFDCTCAKDNQSPQNVGHHRSRSRLAHHSTNRSTHPLRSNAYCVSGIQRNAESNEVPLRSASPSNPSASASGARRAPNLGSVQPSRSPRPPFEESVRSTTRRTPGSEDATSVETEIGYPVVGPATSRGHTTLTNTLYHQEVIVFSQDVSTNTSQTENYGVSNNPRIQVYSDGPPPTQESVTIPEEVNTERASTESQTNHVSGVAVLVHHTPALSGVQSVTTTEEQQQGIFQTIPEQPPQETTLTPTVRAPTIGTESSPFKPLPKTTETSSKINPDPKSGPSQSGRLPTNFYFPSQMRRNRSNTNHGNGSSHRRITSISDDGVDMESKSNTWCCSKFSRANLTSSDNIHHDGAPVEFCCSQITGIRSAETPMEIMVHSIHCSGNCKIEAHLEDYPHTGTCNEVRPSKSLEVSTLQCWHTKNYRKETSLLPPDSEKLALNVMSCISWSDLPNNLAVSDCEGRAVKNVRVLIVPCNFLPSSSYVPNGKPSDQENSVQSRLCDIKPTDDFSGQMYHILLSSKSDVAQKHSVRISTPPQLKSTIAVQASFPVASKPENNGRVDDCSTQSILRDVPPLKDIHPGDTSLSLAPPLLFYEVYQDNTSRHDLWPVNEPLKKHHSECIYDDDSRESICDQWRVPSVRHPKRNVTDTNASVELINQACGPDYPPEITSIAVGRSINDLHQCNNIPISGIAPTHESNLAGTSNQVRDTGNTSMTLTGSNLLEKPRLVITMPEKESKVSVNENEILEPIDMENHLFVKKTSAVSVASSVYIGDDGKAVVTGGQEPRLSVLSVSESRQTQEGPCAQSTGAIPKRELGAKLKIRGETLSVRKKMLAINDSPVRDRSSGMDDIPHLGARGHRVISEKNRGRVRTQVSSRKNHLGIKEPRRSPGRWPHKTASKKSFDSSRRRRSDQPIDEIRSIWINPETEQSSPSSNSTIDITTDLNQAFILSDHPKVLTSSQQPNPVLRPPPDPISKSPEHPINETGGSVDRASECIGCRVYLRPVTTQCTGGHGICAKCLGQRDSCPVCHLAVLLETNKSLDNLQRTFPFPCKINQTGCRETSWFDDQAKFESRSLYRPQTCPLANRSKIHCTWKGVRSGIRPHMKKCHGHMGTVHPFRTLFVVEAFDLRLWENRTYDVEVLFVETEIFELHKVYDSRKSCLWGLLRNILAKDVSLRYTYNIRFQPQNIRGSVTFNSEVIGGAEELDKAFEKGKRFKFYLDSFSQEPIQFFNIHLKIIPKAGSLFHNV